MAFTADISRQIWDTKYRYCKDGLILDDSIEDTWRRVAHTLAGAERKNEQAEWEQRFYSILENFKFLPGGRILAGSGTQRRVTLFNCFVMGLIEDSLDGIFDALKEGALTMQQGGGVGYDFSTLRPTGTAAHRVGSIASGPVSFMRIWDSMCATLLSTGARRGAMMATLRCDHPDIEAFIQAKMDPGELRHFNLSVLISDAFMQAVTDNEDWPLLFPVEHLAEEQKKDKRVIMRRWSGSASAIPCQVVTTLSARELWEKIMHATYDYAEPGVLFIDRINEMNNLAYCEQISSTNPCGEIPLPPYGACDLGSVNLAQFVIDPFASNARLDTAAIEDVVEVAVRLMDNVIDISGYPLPAQQDRAQDARRIGLGVTGLADALIMLGIRYDDEQAYQVAGDIMQTICHCGYRSSIELAREKGAFPLFEHGQYLNSPFIKSLPLELQTAIEQCGIRNSHLTAIAPTGTISLLANNVSSGIEPVHDFHYRRRILQQDGNYAGYELSNYAYHQWQSRFDDKPLPDYFIRAHSVNPEDQLKMQAAVQPYVDNAISKTISIPAQFPFSEFRSLYQQAFDLGLKGCTTFRPNPVTGSILETETYEAISAHCCSIEREAD